jgi:hypothetical protein
MATPNSIATRIWREIRESKLGDVTACALIEREIQKAIANERERILIRIRASHWTFTQIPLKMRLYSIFYVIFKPKKFYLAYFKCIQQRLVEVISNDQ